MAAYKALIKVGYGCNENCTFCHTLETRDVNGDSSEIVRKIERADELGFGMVVLSGGEPTIRPELFAWAAHVARLGMDFGLVTNGLVLRYPDVVKRLVDSRLRYVYQSLHGGSSTIHNRLVRAKTFESARAAVENLAPLGLDYTLNCVVTKQNVDHLVELVDFALDYPQVVLKFSMVQPKGGGEAGFDILTPSVSHVGARVLEAVAHGRREIARRGLAGPRFAHDGIPFCALPGLEDLYDDLKTHRFATMVEIGEPDFFPVDDLAKVQPDEVCGDCSLRGACPGLFQGYVEERGVAELRPVRGRPRSNSFNYVFETLVATDAPEGHCPLRDGSLGIRPWDRNRHLYVRNGGRIARFRTETRDFSDAELAQIKLDRGQVYLDVSDKSAPDDFARDMLQLDRSAECGRCAHDPRCTGLYVPNTTEDVFTRDDSRVRDLLGALRGRVLDVGCGHGPYEDLLAPAAIEGRITYVGLEPDERAVGSLRSRWPWAEVRQGRGEDLLEEAAFDHVLVLRSWNHLEDPARALAAIARATRPGGSILVVDNVAFGLARTVRQCSRAERSTAGFEHFRNDDAGRAVALGLGLGLELLERHDCGPSTSNQWLVRLGVPR